MAISRSSHPFAGDGVEHRRAEERQTDHYENDVRHDEGPSIRARRSASRHINSRAVVAVRQYRFHIKWRGALRSQRELRAQRDDAPMPKMPFFEDAVQSSIARRGSAQLPDLALRRCKT